MNKLFLAGLLAVSPLAYAGIGAPKAKKAKTTCTATSAKTKTCKPGCLPLPGSSTPPCK